MINQRPPYVVIVDPLDPGAWQFRGQTREFFACKSPQAILSGPSDTGKTVTACAKLHVTCLRYPNSRHVIVRKTYASMPGSVLQTFSRIIAGAGVHVIGADSPRLYHYPNGSQVWVGGMDDPEKMLSSERDTIYVNQAEQISLQDWEMLSSRCTGRGAVVEWPQLYGDCNPAGSRHWILEQAKRGILQLFTATHKDNPTLFHPDGRPVQKGETIIGQVMMKSCQERLDALSNLSGVPRKRYYEGKWTTAEGAVYDNFDAAIHESVRPAKEFKRFFLAIDEGYTNPAVILLIGEDSDKRWHCFKEFYRTKVLECDFVKVAKEWYGEFKCGKAAVDASAAGLIADFRASGINAIGGKGRVLDGINKVLDRLKVQGDGRPRYTVDPSCVNHINEFESYVWAPDRPKDTPIKQNDHTMDALRYLEDVEAIPSGAFKSIADVQMHSSPNSPFSGSSDMFFGGNTGSPFD